MTGSESMESSEGARYRGSGTNAAVLLSAPLLLGTPLAAAIPFTACTLVQQLGKRLGQAVCHRLRHDRVVVVVVALKTADQVVGPKTCRHGNGAKVVGH